MNGRNLFQSRRIAVFESHGMTVPAPQLGVFISHSRLDKDKARLVANALKASNVDYYFDENDEELHLADEKRDHLKIVHCIEKGLDVCTHLLGIITENTRESWWVPYEIGSATGRGRACAHLIDGEVEKLPSYIRAARILLDRQALREWLPKETRRSSPLVFELSKTQTLSSDYPEFIPANRTIKELSFY